MKYKFVIIFILCILVFFTFISIKPIIIFLVKGQIEKVFIDSKVSIGSCDLSPLRQLTLSDIEIKKIPIYDFKVQKAIIQFRPSSIIKGRLLKFSLSDANIDIYLLGRNIQDLGSQFNLGNSKSTFSLDFIELSGVNINVDSNQISTNAKLSLGLNLMDQIVNKCNLKIDLLKASGLELADGFLNLEQGGSSGFLSIGNIKYDKLKLRNIEGSARLEDEYLYFDSISAKLFKGMVVGNLSLLINKDVQYLAKLEFVNLDLDTFVNDFKLQEKVQMKGRVSGAIDLEGNGANIRILGGDFAAIDPGGTLTIKDDKYLENLAQRTGQSIDLIVESFKNYDYNTGKMGLSLDKGNLIFDIGLDGWTGKRNLNIILHDFKLTKEAQ